MASATVLCSRGGVYDVQLEDGTVAEAVLRGRLKLEQRTGDRVVAGDVVEVGCQSDRSLTIEAVAPRRSQLARRAPGGRGRRASVIVANIDRVVLVFATARPEPKARLLDRFLVLAEANELDVLIVLNKIDLASDDFASAFLAPYEAAGYPTLGTCAISGHGLEPLRSALCCGRSVVTGPSGVGKSSLLNAVQPGLGLRVAAISEAVRKGRHTTVTAELIPLACGGYVADTPGLRELGLWRVPPQLLATCFPEFRPLLLACRFTRSCTHTHEPGCAVRAAVDGGTLDAARYRSYVVLREEAVQEPGD
jgi:ribosome biogenesis GTPase / thiamine phosphate phosphatase